MPSARSGGYVSGGGFYCKMFAIAEIETPINKIVSN